MVIPVQSAGVVALLERIDGLVLSGGPDVDLTLYGDPAHPESDQPRPNATNSRSPSSTQPPTTRPRLWRSAEAYRS